MVGNLPAKRPDQWYRRAAAAIAAGGLSGVFRGRLVIVQGGAPPAAGIFIYNAAGQLVGDWVGQAGTDPLNGSSVAAGLTTKDGPNSSLLSGASLTMTKQSGALAPPIITLSDNTSVTTDGTTIHSSGIVTPIISADDPSTPGATETWHSLGTLTGFTVTIGSYRLTAQGETEVAFDVTGSGVHGANVAWSVTLPAAYRPNATIPPLQPVATNRVQAAGEQLTRVQLLLAGTVTIFFPVANTTSRYAATVIFPRDL